MSMGKKDKVVEIEKVQKGQIQIDIELGVGGLKKGSIVEIYGKES